MSHLTPLELALIFTVSIVVIIYGISKLESLYSRRERGELTRRQRRTIEKGEKK